MRSIILLCLIFGYTHNLVFSQEDDQNKRDLEGAFCAIDHSGELTTFYCKDQLGNPIHKEEVDPLIENLVRTRIEEEGGEIVSFEEFAARVSMDEIRSIIEGPNNQDIRSCIQKAYYRTNEFNRLPTNHEIINQLKTLARALQEAGVCELPVKRQNFNSINIQSSQDVLHQFLCISNSESVFGTRNIGMGGRGPWGIHPAHNQRAGTRAFLDGKMRTLPRDGACYPSQAIVRDANGNEIKESNRYRAYPVILDNAKCAMTLYRQNGFRDWGTTSAWGSNRHCPKSKRDRLQFFKHIGAAGCCTDACRARFNQ